MFMPEENKDAATAATPEEGVKDEMDNLLDALTDQPDDKKEGDKPEDKSVDKDVYKKVGGHVFKTEAEYDAWANKNYGDVTRLSGEIKNLQDKLSSKNVTPEARKETEQDIESLRMRIRAADFFEGNPDAVNYKEEMAAFIRTGKANDDKGRPSLEVAYQKALKADGKDVPADNKEDIKNVMKAGGGDNGGRGVDAPYKSDGDVKSTSDFADAALTGKI